MELELLNLKQHLIDRNDDEGVKVFDSLVTAAEKKNEHVSDALMRIAQSMHRIGEIIGEDAQLSNIKGEVANAACCLVVLGEAVNVNDGFWELVDVSIGTRR